MGAAALLSALTVLPHGTATMSNAARETHEQRILRPCRKKKRILLEVFYYQGQRPLYIDWAII